MNKETMIVGVVQFVNAPYKDETYRYLQEHYPVKLVIGTFGFEDNHPEWNYANRDAHRKDSVRDYFARYGKKIDALLVSGYRENVSRYALIYAKLHSIPVVMVADTVESGRFGFVKKMIYNMANAFWVPGKRSQEYFISKRVDAARIFTGAYTYDYKAVRGRTASADRSALRRDHGISGKDFVFLFVGKLIPGRRVGDLLNAFERLKPDNLKLIIVGDGEDKDAVDKAAARDKRIIGIAGVELDRLYDLFSMCDAYVHPGKEPYSCAVMQAAAAGMPVVASNEAGAADDFLTDGGNGKIFPYGNIEAMRKAMQEVCENITEYMEAAKKVQDHVCEDLSIEHAAGQLFEALRFIG